MTHTLRTRVAHVTHVTHTLHPLRAGKRQGFEPPWGPRGILKLTHEMPAFRPHPRSGERIWHNHLGVLHSAAWADEFAFAASHLRSVRHAPATLLPRCTTLTGPPLHLRHISVTSLSSA